jgi:hypothetical protein
MRDTSLPLQRHCRSAVAQAVSRRAVTAEIRVRSQLSPSEIFFVDKVALGQIFFSTTLIFPRQYHPTNAPY